MVMQTSNTMKSDLSRIELCLYFFMWSGANLFGLYKLYIAQNEVLDDNAMLQLVDLQYGWNFLGRLKDVSDFEWNSFKYFINTSWIYLTAQALVSEIIRHTCLYYLKHWYILSSVLYFLTYFGKQYTVFILLQPAIFMGIILAGGKKLCLWITSITLLCMYNTKMYRYFIWEIFDQTYSHDEQIYLLYFGMAWILIRCMGFCFDYVEETSKEQQLSVLEIFLNMFSYILYLPLLSTGPIVLYEEFENSFKVENVKLWPKIKKFLWDILIFRIYTFILDLSYHYIYFTAMQDNVELIKKLPTLALCGAGLYMGLTFHMKYVICYGTTTAFARLDNIDAPPTPRCIARIHVYSQMWRYFDVGLYKFLTKYIHKPTVNYLTSNYNFSNFVKKFISSSVTFIFIFLWHGAGWRILIWTMLNYLGVTVESLSKEISKSDRYKWFKNKILRTDAMERRFVALICVPLLVMSALSNFYLFANLEMGHLFVQSTLKNPTLWTSGFVCIALYCCCHISMALEDYPSRTASQSKSQKVH